MSVKVLIPTPLRSFVNKQNSVSVEGSTVGDLLNHLANTHPSLKKHLFHEDGKLRSFINIYVNDEDIRYLNNEQTPVSEKDVVSIIPSIAGGKEEENATS